MYSHGDADKQRERVAHYDAVSYFNSFSESDADPEFVSDKKCDTVTECHFDPECDIECIPHSECKSDRLHLLVTLADADNQCWCDS